MTVSEDATSRNGEPDFAAPSVNIQSSTSKLGDNELFPDSESNHHQDRQKGESLPTGAVLTTKKRSAERQIVKGDPQDASDDENLISGKSCSGVEAGSFPKAPIEELKRRRILKTSNKVQPLPMPSLKIQVEEGNADRPTAPPSNDLNVENSKPLTEKSSSATNSTGGFGKFSSVNPFQFPLSNNKTLSSGRSPDADNTTAGGFRSSMIKPGGFGSSFPLSSSDSGTNGFGSFAAAAAAAVSSAGPPRMPNGEESIRGAHEVAGQEECKTEGIAENPVFSLPCTVEDFNGEENEDCILQLRAKLYRLSCCNTGQNQEEELKRENSEEVTGGTLSDTKESAVFSWKEVGTGPLRILQLRQEHKGQGEFNIKNTSTRVVQRRESTPGGSGTKVILNIPIRREAVVHRQGDKHVMVSTISCEVR
jgi:hypothetical protein